MVSFKLGFFVIIVFDIYFRIKSRFILKSRFLVDNGLPVMIFGGNRAIYISIFPYSIFDICFEIIGEYNPNSRSRWETNYHNLW